MVFTSYLADVFLIRLAIYCAKRDVGTLFGEPTGVEPGLLCSVKKLFSGILNDDCRSIFFSCILAEFCGAENKKLEKTNTVTHTDEFFIIMSFFVENTVPFTITSFRPN
jgi:hypothetical protein